MAQQRDTRKVLESGWELVATGDIAVAQNIVKNLATENGLVMIRVLDCLKDEALDPAAAIIFKTVTLPLFRIISHPNTRSSLILETPLDTIYNFLFGPSGRRLIYLFRATATVLSSLLADESTESEDHYAEGLTATLSVLHAICQLHQNAQVLEELPPIVETLAACVPPEIVYHEARQLLAKIQRRLDLGNTLSSASVRTAVQKSIRPKFKFQRDLPGDLSEEGPRHDNDHADIIDIKILPTAEEIQSSRQEYLPSNDPSEGHLPGLEGLLDRQFRLLREDSIGPLRDAVRIEIEKFSNTPTPLRKDQAARTIGHANVKLVRWEVDRRRGLQVIVEFDQPSAVKAKQTPKQRQEVWDESKQMQIDSLVCLVSSSGKTIFFSVCDPKPTPPFDKRQNRDENDEDDTDEVAERAAAEYLRRSENVPNLNSRPDRATVALRMVEYDENDVR